MSDTEHPQERKIQAIVHRKKEVLFNRYYVRLSNGIARAAWLIIEENLRPGDVIEFVSLLTGEQLGTIKVRLGTFTTNFYHESGNVVRLRA